MVYNAVLLCLAFFLPVRTVKTCRCGVTYGFVSLFVTDSVARVFTSRPTTCSTKCSLTDGLSVSFPLILIVIGYPR